MDVLCHRGHHGPGSRIPDLIYNYGCGKFSVHQNISSLMTNYQANYEGIELASLSNRWCAHRERGCPNDCESGKDLCIQCSAGECSQVHD
ncbi:hypothetical protein F4776DRAFT_613982 [Hypoxylon sp. NC0597]|nr:hypothetical protein F4776DRAFT_613982 [Hypoxylon sp. NC0597]